ncbi:hypothetical protein DN431_05210 [Lactobacillus reuteri]|nr:hypothetical protein [Limosilactobacillus reuteri]MQB82654.1 hypothetical protein [Limosilactobacillus reuteri]
MGALVPVNVGQHPEIQVDAIASVSFVNDVIVIAIHHVTVFVPLVMVRIPVPFCPRRKIGGRSNVGRVGRGARAKAEINQSAGK